MSTVVVERAFAEPVALEDLQASARRNQWCLDAHGVRFLSTYFSRDRRRMICLYEAPDAESVRRVQRTARLPFERAWTAQVVRWPGAEPDGDPVVVERMFPSPVDESVLREMTAKNAPCMGEWRCRVAWSFLSQDALRCVCVYSAPDAESVRQAQRRAGAPYTEAWPATVHEPRRPPEV